MYNLYPPLTRFSEYMKEHATKCNVIKAEQGSPEYLGSRECICDGYHTWDELYEHRITLFIALGLKVQELLEENLTWRSKLHSDGTMFEGQFILGICRDKGEQITYHLPLSRWDDTNFVETLKNAPEFDGHTPDDVLERIKKL